MKLWPSFSSKSKALETLSKEVESLQEKLEDNELDSELRDLEFKSFNTGNDSSSLSGMYGIVDEFYDKAMLQRLYATETWFFIAVHTIAKTIASLPLKLEKRKKIQQNITQSDGSVDKIQKETWIDASAEPEYDILNNPNSIQSSVEFWMLVLIDLMATGDSFIFVDHGAMEDSELAEDNNPQNRLRRAISKIRKTKVRGMYRLSAGMVKPMPAAEDNKVLGGYQINTEYGIFNFDVDDVIHIKLPNPNDPFFGLSPIIPVMKNLLLDKYSAEHMIRFYKQGARLGGVIKTEKKLTKDQLIRLERVFESNFTGKRNHHKTLILPEGMSYDTIEQNPGETSLIEFLKANKEPILAAYNLPPVKVGILDGATFANALIQDKTYYNDTIKPICKIIEASINQHGSILPRLRELRFSFSFDHIESLKEDELNKANTAAKMLESGMSVNEVREAVWKLPPVPSGATVPAVEKFRLSAFGQINEQVGTTSDDTDSTSAETESTDSPDKNPNGVQNTIPTAVLNGAQIQSMVDLIMLIDEGKITRSSALGILEIGFNLTREQAEKILSDAKPDPVKEEADQAAAEQVINEADATAEEVDESKDASNSQNDTATLTDAKPTEGTFEQRVSELVAQAIAQGIEPGVAVPKAISQAMTEGFVPTAPAPEGEKKTPVAPFTKEFLVDFQKATTGEGVDHLILERLAETEAMFKRMEAFFIKVLKRKKKSMKVKAPEWEIITDLDLEEFIQDETTRLYESDLKALRHGYKQSIQSRPLTFPNEQAHKMLQSVAAKKITSITMTTRKQIKDIIVDSFEEQATPQEIASRVRDVFPEISAGRGMTIARTETLTAVSMGQDLKAQEFKRQFPKEAANMKRVWISAQDDRVRDSHIELDGVAVDVGEEFKSGLKFPRDPDCEDASEVINCRCTTIEYFPEDEKEIMSTLEDTTPLADAVDDAESEVEE